MRKIFFATLMGLAIHAPANAAILNDSPDLPIRFFNSIPDICFQVARGHPLTSADAKALFLEPVTKIPPTVAAHLKRVTSWFRLKSDPDNVFIGVGDTAGVGLNACHVVLANTKRTIEVQTKTNFFLQAGGFYQISTAMTGPTTDILYGMEAPDGIMLVSLQAPRSSTQDGEGYQGAIHLNLMPKSRFEDLVAKHPEMALPKRAFRQK